MISIRINNQALDTFPELQMQRRLTTPIFEKSVKRSDYNYPFDIPLTDNNRKLLGFPDSLHLETYDTEYDATLFVDGQFEGSVRIKLTEVDNWEKVARVLVVPVDTTYWTAVENMKLKDLQLDGVRTIGSTNGSQDTFNVYQAAAGIATTQHYFGNSSLAHIESVCKGLTVTDYAFPMVRDTNVSNMEVATGGITQYIYNGWNHVLQVPIDGVRAYVNSLAYWLGSSAPFPTPETRFFTVPMFRLWYVLKKCFTEMGYTVSSELDSDNSFKRILLLNTFSIDAADVEVCSGHGHAGWNIYNRSSTINPQNHMPDMYLADFIAECEKTFNLRIAIDDNEQAVSIEVIDPEDDTQWNRKDWTDKLVNDLGYAFDDVPMAKGIHFSFEFDSADQDSGNLVLPETVPQPYAGMRITESALSSLTANAGDYAYVRENESWYRKNDDGTWDMISVNHIPYRSKIADNQHEVVQRMVPVRNAPHQHMLVYDMVAAMYTTAFITMFTRALPVVNIGVSGNKLLLCAHPSAGSANNQLVFGHQSYPPVHIKPHLINWWGQQIFETVNFATFPYGSSGITNPVGTVLTGYAMYMHYPEDEVGTVDVFYSSLLSSIDKTLPVRARFLLQPEDYANFDISRDIIVIQGQEFFVLEANIVRPMPEVCQLLLLRK